MRLSCIACALAAVALLSGCASERLRERPPADVPAFPGWRAPADEGWTPARSERVEAVPLPAPAQPGTASSVGKGRSAWDAPYPLPGQATPPAAK